MLQLTSLEKGSMETPAHISSGAQQIGVRWEVLLSSSDGYRMSLKLPVAPEGGPQGVLGKVA